MITALIKRGRSTTLLNTSSDGPSPEAPGRSVPGTSAASWRWSARRLDSVPSLDSDGATCMAVMVVAVRGGGKPGCELPHHCDGDAIVRGHDDTQYAGIGGHAAV